MEITGLVLAGGRSERMGQDKGLLPLHGRPLIEYALTALRPQVGALLISANRNVDAYAAYGFPVVRDLRADFQGPLAGIEAGLAAANTGWLLCVPCDAAQLPGDLATRLLARLEESGAELSAVENADGLIPTCCLLPRSLLGDLSDYLDDGERSTGAWLRRHAVATVDYRDWPRQSWSVNTPQELASLEEDDSLTAAEPAQRRSRAAAQSAGEARAE